MTTTCTNGFASSTETTAPTVKKVFLILSALPDDIFEAEIAKTKAMLYADKINATLIRDRHAIDAEELKVSEIHYIDLDLVYRYLNA